MRGFNGSGILEGGLAVDILGCGEEAEGGGEAMSVGSVNGNLGEEGLEQISPFWGGRKHEVCDIVQKRVTICIPICNIRTACNKFLCFPKFPYFNSY